MTEEEKLEKERQEKEKKSNRNDIIWGVFLFLSVISFWYFSWQYIDNYISSNESDVTDVEARGLFGDKFGAINALFSSLALAGIIFTIFLQRRELKLQREELILTRHELFKNAKASKQISEDTKANAIVDLFQTRTSKYFYNLSTAAWNVLMNCLANKKYLDYVVSTFFISEYSLDRHKKIEDIIYTLYSDRIEPNNVENKKKILALENDERHRLDDLINYFSVIALREAPPEVFDKCDFFYDWWRPLFWWIADERYAAYEKDELKIKYSTKPKQLEILERLDKIYGFETIKDKQLRWEIGRAHV